jgi:hypothetical protein
MSARTLPWSDSEVKAKAKIPAQWYQAYVTERLRRGQSIVCRSGRWRSMLPTNNSGSGRDGGGMKDVFASWKDQREGTECA